MIHAKVFKAKGVAYGFEIKNHGEPVVCSAVSMLATNFVNSLSEFTDEVFEFDCDENKPGYMKLVMPNMRAGQVNHDADLLFKSFLLGLKAVEENYGGHLKIKEVQ